MVFTLQSRPFWDKIGPAPERKITTLNEADIVEIKSFPATAEEFVQLQSELAVAPQGGAVMLLLALEALARDEALGESCLAQAIHSASLVESRPTYADYLNGNGPQAVNGNGGAARRALRSGDLQIISSQIIGQPYLPHAFILDVHPESGYRLPPPPYRYELLTNAYSGDPENGVYKLFVACAGAAGPRPVTLRRDTDDLWRASEWNSLIVSIAQPGLRTSLRSSAAVY
jgi:hypothetical protein